MIGYNAGGSTLTGTNNIIIGSGANLSGNVSNEITLGDSSINHFRIPGIGVSFSEGGAVFSGIVTAANFAKADGSSLGGGLTAESNAPRNTHSNNAASALTSNSTNNVLILSLIHI